MNRKQKNHAETRQPDHRIAAPVEETSMATASLRSVTAAAAGIAAAWVTAGSTGLVTRPLQHALAWIGIAVVSIAGWPRRPGRTADSAVVILAALVAVAMTVPAIGAVNVAAVVFVLAAAASTAVAADRKALLTAAYAVAVLAVYRLAVTAVPAVWLAADAIGSALAAGVAAICGKPLAVGATLAGLDFLVLMAALGAALLRYSAPPRWIQAVYVVAAVVVGHIVYLIAIAYNHDLLSAIPKAPAIEPPLYQSDMYVPPPWYWGDAVRTLLPWNMPAMALVIHALTAALVLRWARWRTDLPTEDSAGGARVESTHPTVSAERRSKFAGYAALTAGTLALLIPPVMTLWTGKLDLAGRKIVAYQKGYLDWEKPKYDRYGEESAGMYGMLPTLVASLGGQFSTAADLASPAIRNADVLILIHPVDAWSPDQLQHVWEYVRGGGSLLVMAEPRTGDDVANASFEKLLEPTTMEVRFDTAIPATEHWEDGLERGVHPATIGADGGTNGFALSETSSIRVGWPARPILVGRWGWSDPGSDAVLTGLQRLDPGERLGDLVLAAEQSVGSGSVVVLGDAACLKNIGLSQSYEFTGRLLGYLANHASPPQIAWRQFFAIVGCLALVGLLGWQLDATLLVASLAILVVSLAVSMGITAHRADVLPQGHAGTSTPIACIDHSHQELFSDDPWSDDGLAGLELTLMRNGYLPIVMRHWNERQIERAKMLISIAPARPFDATECAAVRRFLDAGGTMLAMAGANHAGPVGRLLDQYGLAVPVSPLPETDPRDEPRPMGSFQVPYGDTKAYVEFYAGWPIDVKSTGAETLVQREGDPPIVVSLDVGRGKLVVIGDSCFAMNKNLEARDGEPPRGFVENAHFWHWLIARLNGRQWSPPELPPAADDEDKTP